MKDIFSISKKMSLEAALFILFGLGAFLEVFSFVGYFYKFLDGWVANYFFICGMIVMGVSVMCILGKYKFFIWNIDPAPSARLIVMDLGSGEIKIIEECPNDWKDEQIEDFLYSESGLDLNPSSCYYIYGKDTKVNVHKLRNIARKRLKK